MLFNSGGISNLLPEIKTHCKQGGGEFEIVQSSIYRKNIKILDLSEPSGTTFFNPFSLLITKLRTRQRSKTCPRSWRVLGLGTGPTAPAPYPRLSLLHGPLNLPAWIFFFSFFSCHPYVTEANVPCWTLPSDLLEGNLHGPAPTLLPFLISFGNCLFSHLINVKTKRALLLPQAEGKLNSWWRQVSSLVRASKLVLRSSHSPQL